MMTTQYGSKLRTQILNHAENVSVVPPSSTNKRVGHIGPGVSELRSDIQTDKQRLHLYV